MEYLKSVPTLYVLHCMDQGLTATQAMLQLVRGNNTRELVGFN